MHAPAKCVDDKLSAAAKCVNDNEMYAAAKCVMIMQLLSV